MHKNRSECGSDSVFVFQIRVNAVNPTVVMTDMGKRHWNNPERGGPMLAKIPMGRFAGTFFLKITEYLEIIHRTEIMLMVL